MGQFLDVICKITKKNRIEQEPERENSSSTRGKCEICQRRADFGLEIKGEEVGFVEFAEGEW